MAGYIVGIIAGAILTVSPLVYLMNYDRCLAAIFQCQVNFNVERFSPSQTISLASSIAAVGAAVLLISVAMMAITGLRQSRKAAAGAQSSSAPAESEESKDEES